MKYTITVRHPPFIPPPPPPNEVLTQYGEQLSIRIASWVISPSFTGSTGFACPLTKDQIAVRYALQGMYKLWRLTLPLSSFPLLSHLPAFQFTLPTRFLQLQPFAANLPGLLGNN